MPEFVGTLTPPRHSAPPASPLVGQLYYDTDDSKLYYWNGTGWISGGSEYYEQPGTPASSGNGAVWVDTDDPAPTSWTYDSDPVGTVKAYAGSVIPANWVLADGRTLTQAAYPDLAAAMGIGVGQSFQIPDLRNRFIYGASAAAGSAWATGGAATHTLLATESGMPSHTPVASYMVNQQPSWTSGGNFPVPPGYGAGSSGGSKLAMTDAVPAQNASAAHNNMPPYVVLAWIIKVTGPQINAGGALVGPAGAPGITPSYGTSFPAFPIDGQQHILVDSLTNPSYQWHFRYNAGSSSAYKWEFIGGNPVSAFVGANESTATIGAWLDLATVGPRVLIPAAGDYWASGSCNTFSNVAGTSSFFGIVAGAGTPPFSFPLTIPTANQGYGAAIAGARINGVAAGSDVRLRYTNQGAAANTMSWQYRYISVLPVRCG